MTNAELELLLSIDHLMPLRQVVSGVADPIGVGQAQALAAHARSLATEATPLHLAVVHTYTSDLLDPWLDLAGALQGLDIRTYHAPYGLALQEAQPGSALLRHEPHVTLLMLRREDLHPDLARPVVGLDAPQQARLRGEALARLREVVGLFRAQQVGHIALTLLPPLAEPTLGLFDTQSERSEALWWSMLKADIGRWLQEEVPSSVFLDLDQDLQRIGRTTYFDRRFWYSARFPFSPAAARELSRRVAAVGAVLRQPRAKVIALDADNTLWGGIVGEDELEGIALGPEYPGSVYVDFQRRLLDFQQRGIVLALCSKNNPQDVDRVLREHPHQILREEHFAARRVNWLPKVDNLVSLAQELNLGLESFVFVDDSDHECAAVRHRLPQVEVVQVPSRAVEIGLCLDQVARLEILSLTREDLAKTDLYAQERMRRELSQSVSQGGGDIADYLARLGMRMRVRLNAGSHIARLAQLTQKTNQFNLTARRYDEQALRGFADSDRWIVADFSLADVFGDSGIVGLALIELVSRRRARLDNLLMSCRVIGRHAESAFLDALLRELLQRGIESIDAEFIPTAKNALAANFLPQHGFAPADDGHYRRDLRECPPQPDSALPIAVEVEVGIAA